VCLNVTAMPELAVLRAIDIQQDFKSVGKKMKGVRYGCSENRKTSGSGAKSGRSNLAREVRLEAVVRSLDAQFLVCEPA